MTTTLPSSQPGLEESQTFTEPAAPVQWPIEVILPDPIARDRAICVGTTGSGKTTLMREGILPNYKYIVVHDGKGQMRIEDWRGFRVEKTLQSLLKTAEETDKEGHFVNRKMIYQPTAEELASPEIQDRFFRWVYLRGNCVLYVDEVTSIANASEYPFHYFACITRGREKGIMTFTGSQRPIGIPRVAKSETEHWYCFRLQDDEDRAVVEASTGLDSDAMAPQNLGKTLFWYVHTGDLPIGPMKLDLVAA